MGRLASFPGFIEGATKWNLLVGTSYVLVGVLFLLFLPLVAAIAIGADYRGVATRLSRLPGISAGGGGLSALTAFVILGSVWGVAALPAPVEEGDAPTSNISTPQSATVSPTSASSSGTTTAPSPSPGSSTSSAATTTVTGATATGTESTSSVSPGEASPTSQSPQSRTASTTATDRAASTPTQTAPSTTTAPPRTTPTATPGQRTYTVTVTRVVDGDTLEIEYQNGTADTVRLLGVDTPEVHSDVSPSEWEGVPDTEPARECLRRHGEEASEYAKARLAGETVTLELDDESDRRGYYDRLLAYVVHSGETFNERLLQRGLARYYESTFSNARTYQTMESDARAAEHGAWSCQSAGTATPSPTPTATSASGGGGGGSATIATIQADAPGDEYDNLNGEYIEIENPGSQPLDLSGWTVTEGDGVTYAFPDGFTLDPGASVQIHTGSGSDSSSDLYWGQERPVWNNNGDTGRLWNAAGEQVDVYTYG